MSRICRNKKTLNRDIRFTGAVLSFTYIHDCRSSQEVAGDGSGFIEEAVRQIGNLGFPALIAMYLLTRFEKKFDALIELMTELKEQKMKN